MKHYDLLIVDDEQRYADMLARRLGIRNLNCRVCYDGRSAIDILGSASFSVIVLDLQLPDMYGTEVLVRIKQLRPNNAVIILTGHGTEKDKDACLAAGAHAFMNKPLDIDRLLNLMDTFREP